MTSKTTAEFWTAFDRLRRGVQDQARQKFHQWIRDPFLPSLQFQELTKDLWSARITLNYRALARRRGDLVVWFWIGTHAEYDRLIYRQQGLMPLHSVTVYCSSSRNLAAQYYDAGAELGRAIAQNNWTLIYGGNSIGLMKAVADAVRGGGGKVVGITPQMFVDEGFDDKECHELIVTQTMRARKELLEHRGGAFIALPGGLGTFEEILEIIAGKMIGVHKKPIVLLNVADYWQPFLAMIEHGIEQKFIKPKARELFHVAGDVGDAVRYLRDSMIT